MSARDGVWEPAPPGRARRKAHHFKPETQGGPCESRMDGQDYLAREWMSAEWVRWRRVGPDLWEREK